MKQINMYVYNIKQFKIKTSFVRNIYKGRNTLNNENKDHSYLLLEIVDFNKNTKPRDFSKKSKKNKYCRQPKYTWWFFLTLLKVGHLQ